MKIYVAAPWAAKDDARRAAELVLTAGHEVVSSWIDEEDRDYGPVGYYGDTDHRGTPHGTDLAERAVQDLDDLQKAEVFLLLNTQKSEGKTVETGVAIWEGMPILAVGKPTNVFHYLDTITWFDTVEDAIAAIGR